MVTLDEALARFEAAVAEYTAACSTHEDRQRGWWVAHRALELSPEDRDAAESLGRVIADAATPEDFAEARRLLDALRERLGPHDTHIVAAEWDLALSEFEYIHK